MESVDNIKANETLIRKSIYSEFFKSVGEIFLIFLICILGLNYFFTYLNKPEIDEPTWISKFIDTKITEYTLHHEKSAIIFHLIIGAFVLGLILITIIFAIDYSEQIRNANSGLIDAVPLKIIP
jgi:hypothetical protein